VHEAPSPPGVYPDPSLPKRWMRWLVVQDAAVARASAEDCGDTDDAGGTHHKEYTNADVREDVASRIGAVRDSKLISFSCCWKACQASLRIGLSIVSLTI